MSRIKSFDIIIILYLALNISLFNISCVASEKIIGLNHNNTYSLKITRKKLTRNGPEKNRQDSSFSKSSILALRSLLASEDGSSVSVDGGGGIKDYSAIGNTTLVLEGDFEIEGDYGFNNGTNRTNSVVILSAGKSNAKSPKKSVKNAKPAASPVTTSTTRTTTTTTSTTVCTAKANDESDGKAKTGSNNVRRVENKSSKEQQPEPTPKETKVSEERVTNDLAQSKEDFSQIFKVIQDPEWVTSNGDYYIIEFTEQNSTTPLVRLINLSMGLYNKNGNVEEAKTLISAILGSRNLGDPDDEDDVPEIDSGFSGSGLFNLDDIINWDDLDFMDEMPSLFRKLNNIIWF